MTASRNCISCREQIRGRADKKFCSDQCRNAYHNEQNNGRINYIRNVNNILKKNRRILENLNPSGKIKIKKDKLSSLGFNFQYFTNVYKTNTGNTYYFCYEQGYLLIENDFYMLVVKKDFVK